MPIIINELEIIPETTGGAGGERPQPSERPTNPVPPEPAAILRLERVYRERMRRLRAT